MPPTFTRDIRRTLLSACHNPSGSAYGAFTLYSVPFQGTSASLRRVVYGMPTPHHPWVSPRVSVCSLPVSIAFTNGIPIGFFSCGY